MQTANNSEGKSTTKILQTKEFYTKIIIIALLIGALTITPTLSALTDTAVIGSKGIIKYAFSVTAESGYWQDIQNAVDQVTAVGNGNVYIPAGTFNFVNVNESWTGAKVTIPAGVNVYGAPNNRDAYDQNTEWRTVLVMPYDVASGAAWFKIVGSSNPNEPSRFSDIKLVGYRSIDSNSTTAHHSIVVNDVRDFRIDHCYFEHCVAGINVLGYTTCGVIDHNRLVNIYGFDNLADYTKGNIGYGVQVARGYYSTGYGYEPLMNVLGQYTDHSIYIEDNYFSKWRHCVASSCGAHYVFRYNTIDEDFGHFSLDMHGLRETGENRWGTRAAEIYENTLTNQVDFSGIFQTGGSSGVWFNNYIDNSYSYFTLYTEDTVASEVWHLQDFYAWGNIGPKTPTITQPTGTIDFTSRRIVIDWTHPAGNSSDANYPNVDSSWSIAGYKPYTYPHPLVTQ